MWSEIGSQAAITIPHAANDKGQGEEVQSLNRGGVEIAAKTAEASRQPSRVDRHGQAGFVSGRGPKARSFTPPSAWLNDPQQSGGEFTSGYPPARAQTATVQVASFSFSSEISRNPHRRLQHIQRSTTLDPPGNASPLSSRSRSSVGGGNCRRMIGDEGDGPSRPSRVKLSVPIPQCFWLFLKRESDRAD